jgi:hypothetical protein
MHVYTSISDILAQEEKNAQLASRGKLTRATSIQKDIQNNAKCLQRF